MKNLTSLQRRNDINNPGHVHESPLRYYHIRHPGQPGARAKYRSRRSGGLGRDRARLHLLSRCYRQNVFTTGDFIFFYSRFKNNKRRSVVWQIHT